MIVWGGQRQENSFPLCYLQDVYIIISLHHIKIFVFQVYIMLISKNNPKLRIKIEFIYICIYFQYRSVVLKESTGQMQRQFKLRLRKNITII